MPRPFAFEISLIVASGLTIMISIMTGFASLFTKFEKNKIKQLALLSS